MKRLPQLSRFAEAHGFSFANVEVVRWLSLPVAEALAGGLVRAIPRELHAEYVRAYVERVGNSFPNDGGKLSRFLGGGWKRE